MSSEALKKAKDLVNATRFSPGSNSTARKVMQDKAKTTPIEMHDDYAKPNIVSTNRQSEVPVIGSIIGRVSRN